MADFDIKNLDAAEESYIKNILDTMFPILMKEDTEILFYGIKKILTIIQIKFNFVSRKDIYWKQLIQNNNRDLNAIIQMILPFINDVYDSADVKMTKLSTLSELYTKKVNGEYYFTNSQYNRCVILDDHETIDRPYILEYFNNHLEQLIMSIEQASNKLYVNWTDVLPMCMNTYSTSNLFVLTNKKLSNKTLPQFYNKYIDLTPGLSTADIYNTISNLLFNQIKNEKWLIYDLFIENTTITYIKYLDGIFNLQNIHKGLSWTRITETDRIEFKNKWLIFIDSVNSNDNTILVDFYFFFKKYHINSEKLILSGSLIETKSSIDMEDDPCDPFSKKIIGDARNGLRLVPIEEIYLFIFDQISSLKKTWYYYMLYVKNLNILGSFEYNGNTISITAKNIYNFSKSLTNVTMSDRYVALPKVFNSIPYGTLFNNIIHRLYNVYDQSYHNYQWFNINCYYRRLYSRLSTSDYPVINKMLYELIQSKLSEIVFEAMIYAGHLSEVVPNPNITDKVLIQNIVGPIDRSITNYQRSQMKLLHFEATRSNYENFAYYYLTNKTYGELPNIISENSSKKYFDFITSDTIWQFTYAMDWISQINFYHHYANNRVSYVTGSTGVGKSTQVPKLLLYAQKIIDYNLKGKIVCTQPRISPTTGNAKAISREMGVPIIEYNHKLRADVHTSNFNIQYKHSEYAHTSNTEQSYLRIVTDGTLLTELLANPLLCRSSKTTDVTINGQTPELLKKLDTGNTYDIIIVDEAHEHNANMDIILTLMRDAGYINNSLRLVIVSATMDDDEPIYRRYYRFINDNKLYPLSAYIYFNNLDRANMDRRIHISPPGQSTQFKIDEFPLSITESNTITEKNYLQAGIEKTIQVVNKTSDGDLLLFMAGKSDIIESVTQINKRTPANVICLPFYSEMSEKDKLFVENIANTLPNYTRYKEDVLLDESEVTRSVAKNTYKRSIIVATNVAEASITLPKLRYVIDTGYAKVNTFDPIASTNKLVTLPISYSSSVQRKGRVGRVASGQVYYLYAKEKIINNKTMYKIADSDPSNLIVSLIMKNLLDVSLYQIDLSNLSVIKSNPIYSLVKNIIDIQYHFIPGFSEYFYSYNGLDTGTFNTDVAKYFQLTHNEHVLIDKIFRDMMQIRKFTGLSDVLDSKGKYFIIHPDENILRRNKLTGAVSNLKLSPSVADSYYYSIIKFNNLDQLFNVNLDNKIKSFENKLIDSIISVKITGAIRKLVKSDILNVADDTDIIVADRKTNISITNRLTEPVYLSPSYSAIYQLARTINVPIVSDYNNLLWYLYGLINKCEIDIIAVLTMINIASTPDAFAQKQYLDRFNKIHKNSFGDIYFYYNIWKRLQNIPTISALFSDVDIESVINKYADKKLQYISGNLTNIDEYLRFKKLFDTNKLNTLSEVSAYIELYKPDIKINDQTMSVIKNFASTYYLSADLLIEFIKQYLEIFSEISKQKFLSTDTETSVDLIKNKLQISPIFPINSDWNRFLDSYVRAYYSNAVRSIGNKFYGVISNSSVNLNNRTMLDQSYPYLLYHTFDMSADNTVNLLTNINIKYIIESNKSYYKLITEQKQETYDVGIVSKVRKLNIELINKYIK